MLSKQIERAQRKVEEQHYLSRKHTLEYDDVMNEQRRVIYALRDHGARGREPRAGARRGRDRARAHDRGVHRPTTTPRTGTSTRCSARCRRSTRSSLAPERARRPARRPRRSWSSWSPRTRSRQYDAREAELGEELMRALERFLLLQIIDERWREHLHDMDYLREGIHLRGFAQIEPLVAYKNEAFTLFEDLMNTDLDRLRADDLPRPGAASSGRTAAARRRRAGALLPARRQLDRRRERASATPRASRSAPARSPRPRPAASSVDEELAAARPRRAAPRLGRRAARAQRPLLVRVGQEVQALPRGMTSAPSEEPTPARLAAIRDQLKLLANYL